MKKIWIVICFCFLAYSGSAGCTCPYFETNLGIRSGFKEYGSFIVYAMPGDSFLLKIFAGTCEFNADIKLMFENKEISFSSTEKNSQIKLPCTPGAYDISAKNSKCSAHWTIQLVDKSKKVAEPTNAFGTTTVAAIKVLNPDFLFYPNPALKEINLLNETDEIRSVSFYSSSGRLFTKFDVNLASVKIPLEDFPPDTYYMHVATLSNKIIIKKISIL